MKSKEARILQLEEDVENITDSFKKVLDKLSAAARREEDLLDRLRVLEEKLGIKGK